LGRKINSDTRSDLSKRRRDGFASPKKTCRKLGVSFWDYLRDRIAQHGGDPGIARYRGPRSGGSQVRSNDGPCRGKLQAEQRLP
jgi:hypothetical protein